MVCGTRLGACALSGGMSPVFVEVRLAYRPHPLSIYGIIRHLTDLWKSYGLPTTRASHRSARLHPQS